MVGTHLEHKRGISGFALVKSAHVLLAENSVGIRLGA